MGDGVDLNTKNLKGTTKKHTQNTHTHNKQLQKNMYLIIPKFKTVCKEKDSTIRFRANDKLGKLLQIVKWTTKNDSTSHEKYKLR